MEKISKASGYTKTGRAEDSNKSYIFTAGKREIAVGKVFFYLRHNSNLLLKTLTHTNYI